jgi:hypothetical protein
LSQLIVPTPVPETIDGLEFTVVPFPALHALGLLARLMKSIGPALSALGNADESEDISKIAPALAALSPSEAQSLALEILSGTFVWLDDGKGPRKFELGKKEKFDAVFNGRIRTMFKVLGLALRANFAGFTDGSESEPSALQLPTSSP